MLYHFFTKNKTVLQLQPLSKDACSLIMVQFFNTKLNATPSFATRRDVPIVDQFRFQPKEPGIPTLHQANTATSQISENQTTGQ